MIGDTIKSGYMLRGLGLSNIRGFILKEKNIDYIGNVGTRYYIKEKDRIIAFTATVYYIDFIYTRIVLTEKKCCKHFNNIKLFN